MQAMQPALRDYLTKLREDAYIDIKPGFRRYRRQPQRNQADFHYGGSEPQR